MTAIYNAAIFRPIKGGAGAKSRSSRQLFAKCDWRGFRVEQWAEV